jgi:hypothetical protein
MCNIPVHACVYQKRMIEHIYSIYHQSISHNFQNVSQRKKHRKLLGKMILEIYSVEKALNNNNNPDIGNLNEVFIEQLIMS